MRARSVLGSVISALGIGHGRDRVCQLGAAAPMVIATIAPLLPAILHSP